MPDQVFNFDAMMSQANEVAQQAAESESGGSKFKYPLIYTGVGILSVRLLFNLKSQSVARLIQRHKIGESQVPCLRTYGMECPICKAIDNIKNATGVDLSKLKSKSRGLSLVEFSSSTFPVGSKERPISTGDIILMMYPWSVYTQINQFITMVSKNPAALSEVFSKSTGPTMEIDHDADNKYTVRNNPYAQIVSAPSDEEFTTKLSELDNLNEMILPATATADVISQVNKVATELEQEYLNVSTPSYNSVPQMPVNAGTMQYAQPQYQQPYQPQYQQPPYPAQPQYQQSVPQQYAVPSQSPQSPQSYPNQVAPIQSSSNPSQGINPPGAPACYSKYNSEDFTCAVCPFEVQCKTAN